MKIKMEIEFDIPDKLSKFSDAELREAFWEEFLNYAVVSHLSDALRWATNKIPNSNQILEHHQLWGEYLDKGRITNFKVTEREKTHV